LFCIDLAVPRDIDPAVNDLDGVYLYDIDSLQSIAAQSLAVRRKEVTVCEQIIDRHVQEFSAWMQAGRPLPVRAESAHGGGPIPGAHPGRV
jgi:glutamyl-tRNA reductase